MKEAAFAICKTVNKHFGGKLRIEGRPRPGAPHEGPNRRAPSPRAASLALAEQHGQVHPAVRVRAARGNPAGPDVRGVHERGVEDHRAVHPVLHHLGTGGAAASCQCEAI